MKKATDTVRLKETAAQLEFTERALIHTRAEMTILGEQLNLTTKRLQNVEASAQQMSQENAGLRNTATAFANHKERDAETIAKLVKHLDGAIVANVRLMNARNGEQAETERPHPPLRGVQP